MSYNLHKVLIIATFCVAIVFISGILLPRYLSSQYFQLHTELNSQNGNLKYSAWANSEAVSAKKDTQGESEKTVSRKDVKIIENIPNTLINYPIQAPAIVRKRSKRQAPSEDDYFAWNFNFNVTWRQNISQEISKNAPDTLQKQLALFATGEEKEQTAFAEMQNTLRSVGNFIKRFFVRTTENISDEDKRNLLHSEMRTSTSEETANLDIQFSSDGSGEEPFNKKGREGKFINLGSFNLFGFRKSLDKSTLSPQSSTEQETDSVFITDDLLKSTQLVTDFIAENVQKVPNLTSLHSESLVPQLKSPEKGNNISDLNLSGFDEKDNCLDCETVDFESSTTSSTARVSKNKETSSREKLFTDEILERFCMSLVNKVSETQHLSDTEDLNNFDSEQDIVKSESMQSLSQDPDFNSSLLHSVSNTESKFDSMSERSLFITTASENDRQSRFIGFGNLFGSGRAAVDQDESDELITVDPIDLEHLPSILDCENYFRKKSIKMFPKPNLMDMISDPKIELLDFANATISPKLKEQQIQFLTHLLKTNLNNSVEVFDKSSEDTIKSDFGDSNLPESVSPTFDENFNKVVDTEPNFSWTKSFSDESTQSNEEIQTTEFQRDGRFLNFFGLGSGREMGPEQSLSFNLASSEASLSGKTDLNIDGNEEFGSGDSFKDEKFLDLSEDSKTISSNEARIWGFFPFGGSGSGRELPEDQSVLLIENKCENNCSLEITSKQSYDCDDYGCRFENSSEDDIKRSEDDNLKNESGCYEDCYDSIAEYNSNDYGKHENLTESVQHPLNCSCISKISGKNITFSECDECSFGVKYSHNGTYAFSSNSSKFLNNRSSENSNKNDCECNYEKVPDAQILNSDHNVSFSECDDCNVGYEHPFEKSYESTDLPEGIFDVSKQIDFHDYEPDCQDCNNENSNIETNKTNIEGSMTFSDCDECNSSILYPLVESQISSQVLIDTNLTNAAEDFEECHNCTKAETIRSHKLSKHKETKTVNGEINQTIYADTIINKYTNEVNTDSFIETQNSIQNPHNEQTTETNPRRLLGTIFLTGSGDGGLFGDSGGPINLLEEESTIVPPNLFFRKQGRSDDILDTVEEKLPAVGSSRRGRLDNAMDYPCDDCEVDYSLFEESNQELREKSTVHGNSGTSTISTKLTPFEIGFKMESNREKTLNERTATVSTNVSRSREPKLNDLKSQLQLRSCTAARECNATLNERCITITSSRFCGCSKGYVRQKETSKCIVKKIVETSIKLPAENFEDDLNNSFSVRYQQMRKYSIETVRLLLQNAPDLLPILSEIDVVGFSAGSLVVKLNLVFAVENKSEAELVKNVEEDLQKALRDESLTKQVYLDVSQASLVSTNGAIGHCNSSELNYCSVHAYCVRNAALPGSYTCHCKEHYRDVSFNPRYLGETCIAKCPSDYCGPYGHCELFQDDEKHCLCSGLHFGRRCEVPGLYVFIILGFLGLISISMLLFVIFRKRCRRFSYGKTKAPRRFEEPSPHSRTNGKVSDVIALEENVGATFSRFSSISTPLPPPVIRVTRPTINESNSSMDYDSTFDTTPSSGRISEGNSV